MRLEHIEISGFRGIKRLSLNFDELTALIGENTWGKSSLLDALAIALPASGLFYSFCKHDFHLEQIVSTPQTQQLQILLCFKTTDAKEHKNGRYHRFKSLWIKDADGRRQLIYRTSALLKQQNVISQYDFLDNNGNIVENVDHKALAKELLSLHPVIRLRDARHFERPFHNLDVDKDQIVENQNLRIEKRINNTWRRLNSNPGHVNKGEIHSTLNSLHTLIEHYFSFKDHVRPNPRVQRDGLLTSSGVIGEKSLLELASGSKNDYSQLLLLRLLNAYIQAKGPHQLRRCARPILIIEDPEGRLHPTHLLRAWTLLRQLPMQKILTTNSGDLLACIPLFSIRRLVRLSDKTVATSVSSNTFNHDELRRVGFHIRFHRPGALFARCWLLVEGETEVWLFNELAKVCGYNLAAEGIQIIEFAQSGLKALIKVAKEFDIDWHVVTDGDMAGQKYAATVHNQLGHDQLRHRLTELPERDIEHFFYANGFEHLFRTLAHIPYEQDIPTKKVIVRALKKYAKPDLALAIVTHCEKQGSDMIPLLIRRTIQRLVAMANSHN